MFVKSYQEKEIRIFGRSKFFLSRISQKNYENFSCKRATVLFHKRNSAALLNLTQLQNISSTTTAFCIFHF